MRIERIWPLGAALFAALLMGGVGGCSSGSSNDSPQVSDQEEPEAVELLLSVEDEIAIAEGDSFSLEVSLSAAPEGTVDVTVEFVEIVDGLELDDSGVRFDENNWSVPKSITVLAVDDLDVDDDATLLRVFLDGEAVADVAVRQVDNGTPPPATVTLPEEGAVITKTFVLSATGTGIATTTFYADGTVVHDDDTPPFEWTLVAADYPEGEIALELVVDHIGGVDTHTVSVEIGRPPTKGTITGLKFDYTTMERLARGSDNWPITWADDGHQYTSWGDGGGFGGTNTRGRVSLGFARVEGSFASKKTANVYGGQNAENEASLTGKSYGVLAIGDDLYAWVQPGSGPVQNFKSSTLYISTNDGASWAHKDSPVWKFSNIGEGGTDNLASITFMQAGKGYGDAFDGYVYMHAIRVDKKPTKEWSLWRKIDLLRAPKAKLMNRSAYEFFAGFKTDGVTPTWTTDISKRVAVFEDTTNEIEWTCSSIYFEEYDTVVLCVGGVKNFSSAFGFYRAKRPWGPFATIKRFTPSKPWGDSNTTTGFFGNFSPKWRDGDKFVFVATGINGMDSWNAVEGSFVVER